MAYLLGLDIGSSSVKASLIEVESGSCIASASAPEQELAIHAPHPGWAEQDPLEWWRNVVDATRATLAQVKDGGAAVKAIGIAYQMHGLVLIEKGLQPVRPAIIWCDSRAVEIGVRAFRALGEGTALATLLNSPGNFTASKIRWVMEHEPENFKRAYKFLLPGDFIALKLSGEPSTTITGLSEGIFWDFKQSEISETLLNYFEIPESLFPTCYSSFEVQGEVSQEACDQLGVPAGTPIAYRAGDQPNNAFSLNVLRSGEIAATAGTSGVVYGVSDTVTPDSRSRVNIFAHVNHTPRSPHYGVLLCLNGTGILNSWLKHELLNGSLSYKELDELAKSAPIGCEGLTILPFGNGSERILENRDIGASFHGIKFPRHTRAHISRAVQEGIIYALYFGIEIMNGMRVPVKRVRAGIANMFQSQVFSEAFASVSGASVELFNTDGAQGAARGAGLGAGIFKDEHEAFRGLERRAIFEPKHEEVVRYKEGYQHWRSVLATKLKT